MLLRDDRRPWGSSPQQRPTIGRCRPLCARATAALERLKAVAAS